MATTLQELAELLFDAEYKFEIKKDRNEIWLVIGGLEFYKDKDGDNTLLIVIRLSEKGEYIEFFSPSAFVIPENPEWASLFLKACTIIQWKTKLIQFEYDESDGEVRPMIEFPIEDSAITQKQLGRCIKSLVRLIEEYFPVLDKIHKEGIIDFENAKKRDEMNSFMEVLNNLPTEALEELLRKKKNV